VLSFIDDSNALNSQLVCEFAARTPEEGLMKNRSSAFWPESSQHLPMIDNSNGAQRAKIRLGNWFDVAVFLLLSALVIVALLVKLLQYYGFKIDDLDNGIYSNLVWNLVNGNWFYSGVLNRNHLGEHFSPIIVVFAPFFIVHPSPVWLLGAQGLAVGTT